jgi:hypothetical protein
LFPGSNLTFSPLQFTFSGVVAFVDISRAHHRTSFWHVPVNTIGLNVYARWQP